MIFTVTGRPAHQGDANSWRTWAHEQATGRPHVAEAAVIVTPWVHTSASVRPIDAYNATASAILDGLAAAGVIDRQRKIAALIIRAPHPLGRDGVRVEVLDVRRLAALLL